MRNILRLAAEAAEAKEEGRIAPDSDEQAVRGLVEGIENADERIGQLIEMQDDIANNRSLKLESMELDLSTLLSPTDETGAVDEEKAAQCREVALESIGKAIVGAVKSAIAKVVALLKKIIAWLTGKGDSKNNVTKKVEVAKEVPKKVKEATDDLWSRDFITNLEELDKFMLGDKQPDKKAETAQVDFEGAYKEWFDSLSDKEKLWIAKDGNKQLESIYGSAELQKIVGFVGFEKWLSDLEPEGLAKLAGDKDFEFMLNMTEKAKNMDFSYIGGHVAPYISFTSLKGAQSLFEYLSKQADQFDSKITFQPEKMEQLGKQCDQWLKEVEHLQGKGDQATKEEQDILKLRLFQSQFIAKVIMINNQAADLLLALRSLYTKALKWLHDMLKVSIKHAKENPGFTEHNASFDPKKAEELLEKIKVAQGVVQMRDTMHRW